MSRSKSIFRLVARDLPGLTLCKDMLVVAPTELILRGFLLETTTERNRVYLWKVVAPLYRPMTDVILTYGERIPESGEDLYVDGSAYEKSAATIRAIISNEKHLEYLQTIQSPRDFLRHANWIESGSPILQRLDHALTHYLVGNVQQSIEALRVLGAEIDQLDKRRQEYVGPLVKRLISEIDTHPIGLKPLLDEWVNDNVKRLGLQPSRSAPG